MRTISKATENVKPTASGSHDMFAIADQVPRNPGKPPNKKRKT